MTDLRQAAQMALHELEGIPVYRKYGVRISNAITALRTALEQQAEPVGEVTDTIDGAFKCEFSKHLPVGTKLYTTPQQQAEPVARVAFENWAKSLTNYMDLSRFETGYSDCNTDYAWSGWQAALAQPQQQAEPVAWDKPGASFAGLTLTEVRVPFGMTIRFEGGALIVETIHNVKEGKTPAFISCDAHGNIISKERNNG